MTTKHSQYAAVQCEWRGVTKTGTADVLSCFSLFDHLDPLELAALVPLFQL